MTKVTSPPSGLAFVPSSSMNANEAIGSFLAVLIFIFLIPGISQTLHFNLV